MESLSASVSTRLVRSLAAVFVLFFVYSAIGHAAPKAIAPPKEIAAPAAGSYSGAVAAADGSVWITQFDLNRVVQIVPGVTARVFDVPSPNSGPAGIAITSDGAIWFAQFRSGKLGRIDPASGIVAEISLPSANSGPLDVATAPDGSLWISEQTDSKLARLRGNNKIEEFPLPRQGRNPTKLTASASGSVIIKVADPALAIVASSRGAEVDFQVMPLNDGRVRALAACDINDVFWVADKVPKITTSPIIAGTAVDITGDLQCNVAANTLDGTLRFEVQDDPSGAVKAFVNLPIANQASPHSFTASITFPSQGNYILVGFFNGQKVFPDFGGSYSVSGGGGGGGGGGGCTASANSSHEPTLPGLILLAFLWRLWRRRYGP